MSDEETENKQRNNKRADLHAKLQKTENMQEECTGNFFTSVYAPTPGLFESFSFYKGSATGICLKQSHLRMFFTVSAEKLALLKNKTSPSNTVMFYASKNFCGLHSPECLSRPQGLWGFVFLTNSNSTEYIFLKF